MNDDDTPAGYENDFGLAEEISQAVCICKQAENEE